MTGPNLLRALRALRKRKHWSQATLGAKLGISQQEMSKRERGDASECSIGFVERWASALGAYLAVDLRVDGEPALFDARHAAIQEWLVRWLVACGWQVVAEASVNHFGDRGRVDVLAFHPLLRILLIVEIKTRLLDVQDTLGRLDVKVRLASELARQQGWSPTSVVPAFVMRDDGTNRRRVAAHAALFGRFSVRGRAARRWLATPKLPAPTGILMFQADPPAPAAARRRIAA